MGSGDPISEVYEAMTELGYETGKGFDQWQKRIELFHVTPTGGMAFVRDPYQSDMCWLNVFAPNEKPDNNTFHFCAELLFASGFTCVRSKIKRKGVGRLLEQAGFTKIGDFLYEYSKS